MNQHEIERIAASMNQLRPDWPTKQLRTLLADARMVERPRRDVVVALSWVACEANTATPYRVLEGGPWWRAAGVEGSTANRPDPWEPDTICTTCSQIETVCKSRPRFGDDDHTFVSRARNAQATARPVDAVARIVADLRDTTQSTTADPERAANEEAAS